MDLLGFGRNIILFEGDGGRVLIGGHHTITKKHHGDY